MAEHADATAPPDEIRQWLVDGYNVMHAVLLGGADRSAFWTPARRQELISRLATFPGLQGAAESDAPASDTQDGAGSATEPDASRVIVVFDGPRPHAPGPDEYAVALRFEPSADDWIVRRVRRAESPGSLGVVTSDRQVAGRCRHAGARVVSPRQFLAWCHRDGCPPSSPS